MKEILSLIDHTILNADATKEMVKSICEEAIEYNFKAVCVNPCHVKYCKELLEGTKISLASVIGFPLGANTSHVKSFETKNAIDNGANEIDMVINIGALKSKDYDIVLEDIKEVVNVAKDKALVKVIIETSLLNNNEKRKACELAMEAGADFVKTSTGFSTSGASIEDIRLMKEVVGDKLGIKASGGIRDLETACAMVNAGATRLGASAGVKIAKEL